MHAFLLIQQSSADNSNQQALLVSSLVAICTQPTISVIQQLPSDQRAQMKHEQQQTQPMITQQQLRVDTDYSTVRTPPPDSSPSSPTPHLSDRQLEKRKSM